MHRKLLIRLCVGALALSAAGLTPAALADGSSTATNSTGSWLSTTPAGSSTPQEFTRLATGSVSNDSSITAESDLTPTSAFNASGDGVVAWENASGDHIEASFIKPGGTWSEPERVGTGVSPVAAVDSAGDAVVVFEDLASGSESAVYAYSPAGTESFNLPVKIDGLAPEENPQVVFESGGEAWVTWSDAGIFGSTNAYKYASLTTSQLASGANASASTDPVAVNTLDADEESGFTGRAVLATNAAGGGVVAAWTAYRPTNPWPSATGEIDVAYAAPGQTTFGPATSMPDPHGDFTNPAVAVNSSGGAVVSWDQCGDLGGGPFCGYDGGGIVEVASASSTQLAATTGPAFNPVQSLAPASDGGDLNVTNIDQYGEFEPSVAVSDNEVAVAWDAATWNDDNWSFLVDGATEPLADLNGNAPDWTELSGIPASDKPDATAYGGGPQITLDASSDLTVAWNDGNAINVATAPACAAACPSTTVTHLDTDAASGSQNPSLYEPSLAADASGDLLLSWLSDDDPHISPATVAATYDAGPKQTEFEIPTTATAGTPASFMVQSSDIWSGLSGPVVTTWNFGDGTSATGADVTHTYASPGAYTVSVVSRTADGASSTTTSQQIGASSTTSQQILVNAPAATTPSVPAAMTPSVPAATTPSPPPAPAWTGAAWGSDSVAGSVTAELTVPALACQSGHGTSGQELGVELWGGISGAAASLTDFAGVDVKCNARNASYTPAFTVANVTGGTTSTQTPSLSIAPGDLLRVQISDTATGEQLTVTDLSQPSEHAASTSGPSLVTHTGWQAGAFPIPGVDGPVQTLATGFADVSAGGTGISQWHGLVSSSWGPASVSNIGGTQNQFSVLYKGTPQQQVGGGSNAIPANGSDQYQIPGSHRWVRLNSFSRLPNGTIIDASGGTVQLTSTEPHGQTQSVTAWGGEFKIHNKHNGATVLIVSGTWNGSNGSGSQNGHLSAHKTKKKTVTGNLWTKGHGNESTKGNYGSAAVLGTEWLTRNLKHGTLFEVAKNHLDKGDTIKVTIDYPKRHTVTLRQGQSVIAPAPIIKKKPKAKPKPAPRITATLSGATETGGYYNVQIGGSYKLTAVSAARPVYVDAAVNPLGPLGGDTPFLPDGTVNGTPRWSIYFTLTSNLADFHYWAVGIRVDGQTFVFKLRIT